MKKPNGKTDRPYGQAPTFKKLAYLVDCIAAPASPQDGDVIYYESASGTWKTVGHGTSGAFMEQGRNVVTGAYLPSWNTESLVHQTDYGANTILKADTVNTPSALTVAEQTLLGRITGGNIAALTVAQMITLLHTGTGVLQSKLISSTRVLTNAAGSVSYTGVGFKPTAIIAVSGYGVSAASSGSIGLSDSARGNYCIGIFAGTIGWQLVQYCCMYIYDIAVGGSAQAYVISYDTDGFTLSWAKNGSPTITVTLFFLCLK